jgi:predicted metal-dependent hydrolase
MAKPALIDYVVAHELAHLRVRPHSAEYWAVVAQAIPDYRLRRAELADAGKSFGW